MEERILKILNEINGEIVDYQGKTMLEDGVIDSFDVIDIISSLEEEFGIEIDAEYAISENFSNKNAIINMVNQVLAERRD